MTSIWEEAFADCGGLTAVTIPATDVAEDAYYAPAVQWAAENQITLGTSATTFDPKTNCTRAQIVVFLYRTGIG